MVYSAQGRTDNDRVRAAILGALSAGARSTMNLKTLAGIEDRRRLDNVLQGMRHAGLVTTSGAPGRRDGFWSLTAEGRAAARVKPQDDEKPVATVHMNPDASPETKAALGEMIRHAAKSLTVADVARRHTNGQREREPVPPTPSPVESAGATGGADAGQNDASGGASPAKSIDAAALVAALKDREALPVRIAGSCDVRAKLMDAISIIVRDLGDDPVETISDRVADLLKLADKVIEIDGRAAA